jgi:hypothetical protein
VVPQAFLWWRKAPSVWPSQLQVLFSSKAHQPFDDSISADLIRFSHSCSSFFLPKGTPTQSRVILLAAQQFSPDKG